MAMASSSERHCVNRHALPVQDDDTDQQRNRNRQKTDHSRAPVPEKHEQDGSDKQSAHCQRFQDVVDADFDKIGLAKNCYDFDIGRQGESSDRACSTSRVVTNVLDQGCFETLIVKTAGLPLTIASPIASAGPTFTSAI